MSRGPQKAIDIPAHWWKQLEQECKKRGIENVDQLCEQKTLLSAKTIKKAEKSGKMTEASFRHLAKMLGYATSHDLKEAWNRAAEMKTGPDASQSKPASDLMPDEIRVEFERAKAFTEADKFSEAIPILEQALVAADRSGHAVSCVKVRLCLAHALYESREDFVEAEQHYRDSVALVPADNLDLKHNVLHGLGDMLLFAGRLDEADAVIAASMDVAKLTGKSEHLAGSLVSQSLLDRVVGLADRAGTRLDEAVKILLQRELTIAACDRKHNDHMLAVCYINQALLCRDAGRTDAALSLYAKAEERHRRSDEQLDAGKTLLFCGEVHCAGAEWEIGFDCFRRALECFQESGNALWGARSLERIARLYATHERWEEALGAMLGAATGAKESGHPGEQVHFLCLAAKLLREWKEKNARKRISSMIHAAAKDVPPERQGDLMASLSNRMNEMSEAIEKAVREDEQVRQYLEEAKGIARKENLHEHLANCLLDEAHGIVSPEDREARDSLLREAIELLKQTLRTAQAPKRKAHLMGRLSALYGRLGDRPTALSWLKAAGEVFESAGDPQGLANYYGSLAELHRAEHRPDAEIAAYRKVLAVIEGRSFFDLAAGTRINLAAALRYAREFEEAQKLLDEAEAICERHHFREFMAAIARNRSDIERELQAAQAPSHSLKEMLESLRDLIKYRPEQAMDYLPFWYFTWKGELMALLRSGPQLSFMVITDDMERFLKFAARFRHLADHFLMTTSVADTVEIEPRVLPIPPEWQFPATFPFLFMRRADTEATAEGTRQNEDGDSVPSVRLVGPATMLPLYMMVQAEAREEGEGHIMALSGTKLPQIAIDLMLGRPTSELIERRCLWLPTDRSSSKDQFLTDLRIGHERGVIPVYFDRVPSSDAVVAVGGVHVDVPNSLLEGEQRPSAAAKWTRALLKLSALGKEEARRSLLDLPDLFPEIESRDVTRIEIRLFEISEIGSRVLQPVLLVPE